MKGPESANTRAAPAVKEAAAKTAHDAQRVTLGLVGEPAGRAGRPSILEIRQIQVCVVLSKLTAEYHLTSVGRESWEAIAAKCSGCWAIEQIPRLASAGGRHAEDRVRCADISP